jgi:hypothetical protein
MASTPRPVNILDNEISHVRKAAPSPEAPEIDLRSLSIKLPTSFHDRPAEVRWSITDLTQRPWWKEATATVPDEYREWLSGEDAEGVDSSTQHTRRRWRI